MVRLSGRYRHGNRMQELALSAQQWVIIALIGALFVAVSNRETKIVVQDCAPGTWKMERTP